MHLIRHLLDAVDRGEQPRSLLERIERDHLRATCPVCQAELDAHRAGGRLGGSRPPYPGTPVEWIRKRLRLREGELQAYEQRLRRQVRAIVRLAPGERRGRVWGAYSRYRGPLFGALLLEEARRCFPGDPAEALSLAEAVLVSCERSATYRPDPEIQAPALAVRGNALRALGRFREAEAELARARELLDDPAVTDPATPAEVYSYLGSLWKDQGRLEDAVEALDLAARLFDVLGDLEKAGRVFLSLGTVQFRRGDLGAAVSATERALECLPAKADDWFCASAHFNRAYYLHARGEVDRAEAELASSEDVLAAEGAWGEQHLAWLRARIAWSREDAEAAERFYGEVRRLAAERGIPFDAALAGLELALVHLFQGRTGEVKSLATEALRVFREQAVQRETRAALDLLEAANRQDAVTRELLERTIAALEGAALARRASPGW